MKKKSLPLSHITVLDLSRVMAGPWGTQILGDLGARVIKVEMPGQGDLTRTWGPPFFKSKKDRTKRDAAYFLSANRAKKSVTINYKTKQGQTLIKRLAGKCDCFVENFKVGTLKKYGLDYDSLKKLNPKIIYCSISGFGQPGHGRVNEHHR
jgi:crotonobetainyl-CoA:carnitine CoA-transferase CaiB-like acyl-CoA transferase